jgi:hypothetical protein
MEIPVIIESVPGNGYRVSGAELFAIVAEGATAEEALAQFKKRVTDKLQNGARIASVEIQGNANPWLESAGIFDPQDPIVQEWLQIIQEERERDDEASE